jgi:hypothetical protein
MEGDGSEELEITKVAHLSVDLPEPQQPLKPKDQAIRFVAT